VTHLGESLRLDLANAPPSHVEVSTDLVEGGRFTIAQPVTHLDDGAFSFVESLENVFKILDVELGCNQFEGSGSFGVLDEVSDGGIVFTNRLEYRNWFWSNLACFSDLVSGCPDSSASSSSVGLRPRRLVRLVSAECIWVMVSIMWTGTLIVRLLSAIARVIA